MTEGKEFNYPDYFKEREKLKYYGVVKRMLEQLGERESIIDVGSADTPVATYGDFRERYAVNLREVPPLPGVKMIVSDWLNVPQRKYSVVTCLQVIEHLPHDVLRPFIEKLFRSGRVVIISVPYNWPEGFCDSHVHDPIDIVKFLAMLERDPVELHIVDDGNKRIVARFV